jgi:hypothetical protein
LVEHDFRLIICVASTLFIFVSLAVSTHQVKAIDIFGLKFSTLSQTNTTSPQGKFQQIDGCRNNVTCSTPLNIPSVHVAQVKAIDIFGLKFSTLSQTNTTSPQGKFQQIDGCRNNVTCSTALNIPFVLPFP